MVAVETQCRSEAIVHKYIDDVLDGTIPACKYLKLAARRHLDDLVDGHERDLLFDPAAGQTVIDFVEMLKHSKGKWAGQNFILEPWQQFIFWVAFGWMMKDEDGDGYVRRFNTIYQEVARKNGKSTQVAGLGLYGLGFDGEGGSEIYSVATKEAQAMLTLTEAQRMTRKSDYLGGTAAVHKKSITIEDMDATWKPLGRDSKNEDGLNPHMILVDEFHAHPDRSLLEVTDSAIGSRSQAMIYIITTAGFNVQSPCYYERDYVIKVLEGSVEDDTYFGVIYTLDRDENTGELIDDWKDPAVWIKANPNYGVSLYKKDMKRMCNKAANDPAAVNNFLTKRMNVWTTQVTRFFNMEKWNTCPYFWKGESLDAKTCRDVMNVKSLNIKILSFLHEETAKALIGEECFIGVDLASKEDICAVVAIFPRPDGQIIIHPKFYCPTEGAKERSKKHRVPYLMWSDAGFLKLTDGTSADYDYIKKDIQSMFSDFDVKKIAFDVWNSRHMLNQLVIDGLPLKKVIEFGQSTGNFTEPTKTLSALVNARKITHNSNPVLKWMASNTAVFTDGNDNKKPMKNKSSEKIDGIVAALMALGVSLIEPGAQESVYEKRGLVIL
jgi:phage terminase large subunit-like protein